MIPIIDESTDVEFTEMPSENYKVDYKDRIYGHSDGLEAMKQTAYRILLTERYKYMIYDWNYRHADNAFYNNQIARRKKVIERLKAVDEINDKFVTEIYNRVLAEDVEDFIQNHMRVQNCDRVQVEIEIAEAMAEIMN